MVIGEEGVMAALVTAKPEAKATTVMTSVVRALRALGARRLVVATPYLDEVNDYVLEFLVARGFEKCRHAHEGARAFQGLTLRDQTRSPTDLEF